MFKRAVIALLAVAAVLPFASGSHGHSPAGYGVVADPGMGYKSPTVAASVVRG
ncbi:hypothetical protein AB0L75_02255 [Streptomyces sp. NPDC052101]|uniref:hypothetical protein n=1 Tax=Streptomyces sp. NPDC052101 TaxID=3155763 RepID=UPI003431E038